MNPGQDLSAKILYIIMDPIIFIATYHLIDFFARKKKSRKLVRQSDNRVTPKVIRSSVMRTRVMSVSKYDLSMFMEEGSKIMNHGGMQHVGPGQNGIWP